VPASVNSAWRAYRRPTLQRYRGRRYPTHPPSTRDAEPDARGGMAGGTGDNRLARPANQTGLNLGRFQLLVQELTGAEDGDDCSDDGLPACVLAGLAGLCCGRKGAAGDEGSPHSCCSSACGGAGAARGLRHNALARSDIGADRARGENERDGGLH
jgi:hypothetical protein